MQFVRPLYISRSRNEGRGVFTGTHIFRGRPILTIVGPRLPTDQVPDGPEGDRAYQIGPGLYITPRDPYGPFMNHSCEPNCGFHIRDPIAMLVAIRDIAAGEELTFDYATIAREDPWRMACACGTQGCRRMIGEFKDVPPPLQRRYVDLGIVSDYVRGAVSR